ncbi:hypothetical protein TKK_0013433 [Trichogramma kaykai]|uniref:Serine/threonine-protein phosphatase n=1 Tax=Trichogramma kaykai TaxID=54128 RepID=A0ABD2WIA7_9HYME
MNNSEDISFHDLFQLEDTSDYAGFPSVKEANLADSFVSNVCHGLNATIDSEIDAGEPEDLRDCSFWLGKDALYNTTPTEFLKCHRKLKFQDSHDFESIDVDKQIDKALNLSGSSDDFNDQSPSKKDENSLNSDRRPSVIFVKEFRKPPEWWITSENEEPDRISITERMKKAAKNKLSEADVFDESGQPRVEVLRDHLLLEGRIDKSAALRIIYEGTEALKRESNLIEVDKPVTVCGDIRGQYYDLMTVFKIGGVPRRTKYLFLGNYVGKGRFGIECIFYLWSLKIRYPNTFFLLRGNHESRYHAENCTFKNECEVKYDLEIYEACLTAFNALPLAALVNKKFFCIHGGLTPEILHLEDIIKINRFTEPSLISLLSGLLGSNPCEHYGTEKKSLFYNTTSNSFSFSYKAVCDFLTRHDLLSMIRAHEVQGDGFELYRMTDRGFPSMITIFSAPNYQDMCRNTAAIIIFQDHLRISQFDSVPHPPGPGDIVPRHASSQLCDCDLSYRSILE